jgi:hypothetical protein
MSRWAEAFRASVRSRDTVDTADTSSPDRMSGPAKPPPCVNSVSGVTGPGHAKDATGRPFVDELSTVSAVSRVAKLANAAASGSEQAAATERAISVAYIRASLQRPPSWSDPVTLPSCGCFCSCCKGQQWWCERETPKGWRCWTCHPPDHLPAEAVMEIRT